MKQITKRFILLIIVATIPAVVVAMNVRAGIHWYLQWDLEKNGRREQMRLIHKTSSESWENSTYDFALRSFADSAEFVLEVDESLYYSHAVGKDISVLRHPSNPERAAIPGNLIYLKGIIFALVGDLLLFFLVLKILRIRKVERHVPPSESPETSMIFAGQVWAFTAVHH